MKRRLVLSLCAVALTAICMSSAHADVAVALNLRYNDPADPSEGGRWTLVAKASSNGGLTGLTVRISGLDPAGTESVATNIGHEINGGAIKTGVFAGFTEFVYGQNESIGTPGFIANVGRPTFVGNDPTDNLDPQNVQGVSGAWDNVTVIATGTVSTLAVRPAFVLVAANELVGGEPLAATITQFGGAPGRVRGDSLETLGLETPAGTPNAGLLAGDANRDGIVNFLDFSALSGGFPPGPDTWESGDFNDSGSADFLDFSALSGNFGDTGVPPAIVGVPEPASCLLLGGFGLSFLFGRRRRS